MAEQIRRVGPPQATGVENDIFTWRVPLSENPPTAWAAFFGSARESTSVCQPGGVVITTRDQTLVFKSEKAHVREWIQHIDKWIEAANAATIKQEEEVKRQRTVAQDRAHERERRLREANEEFKNL